MTLTVTEKGYSRRPGTGGLDTGGPRCRRGPRRDGGRRARRPGHGRRQAGRLARRPVPGRRQRRSTSCPATTWPPTAPRSAGVVRGFVEARRGRTGGDARLAGHRRSASRPPSSTASCPATTAEDRDAVAAALGLRDEMPVVGEPYRQWVLEDSFVAAAAAAGSSTARWSSPDVAPYQLMKLRLLNGSHSAMAYLGAAAGCRDGRRRAGDRVGRAAGARPRRGGRADPARRRARTPPRTSTTWSNGSATPRCSTCCGRSARTDR